MAVSTVVTLSCLATLALTGLREGVRLRADRARIPILVHVNGTRGKSRVTRLIWAGLHAAGIPAAAKTTGAAARMLLPDGSEAPVPRRGPPNIREQVWVVREARRLGAEALVVECMALQPELQWITEHRVFRSTVGVITNVRTDHTEVMGSSRGAIAAALASTVPAGGTLVLGPTDERAVFERVAASRRTALIDAAGSDLPASVVGWTSGWDLDNVAVALAVTRTLGVADCVAAPAMAGAPIDPGERRRFTIAGVPALDASSANDPESLRALLGDFLATADQRSGSVLLVFNHRRDRPDRFRTVLDEGLRCAAPATVMVTGERPAVSQWRGARRSDWPIRYVPPNRVRDRIRGEGSGLRAVVICGNSRGLDIRQLEGE